MEEIFKGLSLKLLISTEFDFLSSGESFLKSILLGLRSISTFTKAVSCNLLTGF